MQLTSDPEGVSEILALLQSADKRSPLSGGLRCAATTGYYLRAFQAQEDALLHEMNLTARLQGAEKPTRMKAAVSH